MEASAPILRADIGQLERVQRLATRLVWKGFTNPTSSRWNADVFELTSSWPSTFSKVKLSLTCLNFSSAHPEPGFEGTPTDYCKDHLSRCLLSSDCEILEQTSGTSSLVTISIYLSVSMVRNPFCSTCVISVAIFLYTVTPGYLCFSLPPNPD